MRATLILALTLFVAGASHVEAQRPRSRLQQMFTELMDDMGDMANRIGYGFLRLGRERPAIPRQQHQLNGPARQQDENAIAPNDPGARPLPAVRQRPRLTFRQFVDGVFNGLSNMMPRLRRRVFNRNNRGGQVSQDVRHLKRRSVETVQDDLISEGSSPDLTQSPTVQVTVNVFERPVPETSSVYKDPGGTASSDKLGPEPDKEIQVNYFPSGNLEVGQFLDGHITTDDISMSEIESSDTDLSPVDDWPPFNSWIHGDEHFVTDDSGQIHNDQMTFTFEHPLKGEYVIHDHIVDNKESGYQTIEYSQGELNDEAVSLAPEDKHAFSLDPGFRYLEISVPSDSQGFRINDRAGYLEQDHIRLKNVDTPHFISTMNNHNLKPKVNYDSTDILSSVFLSHVYNNQDTEVNRRRGTDVGSYPLGFKEGFLQGFSQGFDKGQIEEDFDHQPVSGHGSSEGNWGSTQTDYNRQEGFSSQSDGSNRFHSGTGHSPFRNQHVNNKRPANSNRRPISYNSRPSVNSQSNTYRPNNQGFNNQPNINYRPNIHSAPSYDDNQPAFTNIDQTHDDTQYTSDRPFGQQNIPFSFSDKQQNIGNRGQANRPAWFQASAFRDCGGRCMWDKLMHYLDHFSNSEHRRRR